MINKQTYLKYFPFKSPRPEQLKSLDFALASFFTSNKKYCALSAPCGSGKSAIAVTLAKYFTENEYMEYSDMRGAYIITTQKVLQEQYIRDFPFLCNISAKQNYQCKNRTGLSCEMGLTIEKTLSSADEYKNYRAGCCYTEAKNIFVNSDLSLTNLHFFLANSKSKAVINRTISTRKLLIIDEAHNLENIVIDFIGLNITKYYTEEVLKLRWTVNYNTTLDSFMNWLNAKYMPALMQLTGDIESKIRLAGSESELVSKAMLKTMKRYEEANRKYENLKSNVEEIKDNAQNWVLTINATEDIVSIKPLYIKNYTQNLLFNYGEKVLLMSGTILNKKVYCETVGIPESECEFLSLDSTFPEKNRPIFFVPVGSMSRKNINDTLPKMLITINELLEHHKKEKGIIFCHTYQIAKYISDNSVNNSRLLFHSSADRMDVLDYHCTSPKPTVLVTPSLTEGIDLRDDLSRFQIIAKCMFPYLGDNYIRTKMEKIAGWYEYQTAKSLIQASGRSIRNIEDTAVTYILDSDIIWWYKQNSKFFPDWWKKSIIK